jgi:hypothetical protein
MITNYKKKDKAVITTVYLTYTYIAFIYENKITYFFTLYLLYSWILEKKDRSFFFIGFESRFIEVEQVGVTTVMNVKDDIGWETNMYHFIITYILKILFMSNWEKHNK